jgi:hypothetical protein
VLLTVSIEMCRLADGTSFSACLVPPKVVSGPRCRRFQKGGVYRMRTIVNAVTQVTSFHGSIIHGPCLQVSSGRAQKQATKLTDTGQVLAQGYQTGRPLEVQIANRSEYVARKTIRRPMFFHLVVKPS